jgi:hypothetical protein
MTRKTNCPKCFSTQLIPIAYGMPNPDTVKARDRGEVEIGGCVIWDDDQMARWRCTECKTRILENGSIARALP